MRGHGTYMKNGTLYASVAGVIQRVNKLISVTPLKTKYQGEIGDVIVGKHNRLHITSCQESILNSKFTPFSPITYVFWSNEIPKNANVTNYYTVNILHWFPLKTNKAFSNFNGKKMVETELKIGHWHIVKTLTPLETKYRHSSFNTVFGWFLQWIKCWLVQGQNNNHCNDCKPST